MLGWVILDGLDPLKILHRSSTPILSPDLWWEAGAGDPLDNLTPNVVFVEGWQRDPTSHSLNRFVLYLGGADSVVGAAELAVEREESGEYSLHVRFV